MRSLAVLLLIVILALVAVPAAASPADKAPITATGGIRFYGAGASARFFRPIVALDLAGNGTYTVRLFEFIQRAPGDGSGRAYRVRVLRAASADSIYQCDSSASGFGPRHLDLSGASVDSAHVTLGTATKVIPTYW